MQQYFYFLKGRLKRSALENPYVISFGGVFTPFKIVEDVIKNLKFNHSLKWPPPIPEPRIPCFS